MMIRRRRATSPSIFQASQANPKYKQSRFSSGFSFSSLFSLYMYVHTLHDRFLFLTLPVDLAHHRPRFPPPPVATVNVAAAAVVVFPSLSLPPLRHWPPPGLWGRRLHEEGARKDRERDFPPPREISFSGPVVLVHPAESEPGREREREKQSSYRKLLTNCYRTKRSRNLSQLTYLVTPTAHKTTKGESFL